MADTVREPIQVYLSSAERARLDDAARALGVSRSEVLRRGVEAVSEDLSGVAKGILTSEGRAELEWLSPASAPPRRLTRPPAVATLAEILAELDDDRADR